MKTLIIKLFPLVLLWALSTQAQSQSQSQPQAQLIRSQGEVSFDGKPLGQGAKITRPGILKTGPKAFLQLKITPWNNTLTLGPQAQLQLILRKASPSKGGLYYSLKKGVAHWRSGAQKSPSQGRLSTKMATFGVRGTDFIVKVSPLLDETEIIVFSGQVLFQSRLNPSDRQLLGPGQWGGIGGRYGRQIGEILDLPPRILKAFRQSLAPLP